MRFVDHVSITVRSGGGGAGCVAFRREKYVPKGGPSGGDGGRGGSVLIEADPHLYTLLDLRYNRHQFAQDGRPGEGNNRSGKDAQDLVLRVPCGTLARRTDTGAILGEVVHVGERLALATGGKGGRGNARFKTATRQTPHYAQPGEPGHEVHVVLELKLLADVGLVGLPNAGKSTLVASVSAAKPKIADYPFTTLVPMPAVVRMADYESFVMADIPGIIEGASSGKGLGFRFLRHIERNAVLLYMIPVTSADPMREYRLLRAELQAYDASLPDRAHVIAFSKADMLPPEKRETWLTGIKGAFEPDQPLTLISAVSGFGLAQLKRTLLEFVKAERAVRKSW